MNENRMLRVFVYGTLKRGFENHERHRQRAASSTPPRPSRQSQHVVNEFPESAGDIRQRHPAASHVLQRLV